MNFCIESTTIAFQNYKKYILPNAHIKAIVLGGSVSRGYANTGCDIDILYFDDNVQHYMKRFDHIDGIQVELHYVPTTIFNLLYSYITPILNNPIEVQDVALSVWGEKKCPRCASSDSETGLILSAWRELKKLLDGTVIYDNTGWYHEMTTKYRLDPNAEKICTFVQSTLHNSSGIDSIINMMKFYMLSQNSVFSKVYWTDYYLEKELNAVKNIIAGIFVKSQEIEKWIIEVKHRFNHLKMAHRDTHCSICQGDIIRCNVGRCANDFISDAIRADENGFIVGGLLSLKRANAYVERLAQTDALKLPEMSKTYYTYWEQAEQIATSRSTELEGKLFGRKILC